MNCSTAGVLNLLKSKGHLSDLVNGCGPHWNEMVQNFKCFILNSIMKKLNNNQDHRFPWDQSLFDVYPLFNHNHKMKENGQVAPIRPIVWKGPIEEASAYAAPAPSAAAWFLHRQLWDATTLMLWDGGSATRNLGLSTHHPRAGGCGPHQSAPWPSGSAPLLYSPYC